MKRTSCRLQRIKGLALIFTWRSVRRNAVAIPMMLLYVIHGISQSRPVDLVYPLLDAAHSRWFYFSSAARPFGMVNLFPDNNIDGEWDSGYRYDEDTIRCFTHIHEWQLSGVAVMPVAFRDDKELRGILGNRGSQFSHTSEVIKPGYHAVDLERYDIRAEVTASDRAGFHRYHYQADGNAGIIFELGGQLGPSDIVMGGFKKISDSVIQGFIVNGSTIRRPKETPVYFTAEFNRPIKTILLYERGAIHPSNQWGGNNGKMIVLFDSNSEPLLMKVGVSFTSEEGALKNLQAEIPHWNFDRTTEDAQSRWNEMLSRIQIEGGTLQQQRRFYTDLWKAIQGRRMMSDVDGKYADLTGPQKVIRQVPLGKNGKPKFNMYNSDAFWGAQWTLNTLWQLVYPEIAEEFCNSFLEYYKNGGLIPRGPSGGNYTFVMTGASSTPFFVSAWQKGIRGFDVNLAYEGLKKNHMHGGLMGKSGYEHQTARGGGIEFYIKKGYVPYSSTTSKHYGFHEDGAGMTLEYAYQDWTLAQFAKAIGKQKDYEYFRQRSLNYKNLYNKNTGYIQPKDTAGNWNEPFDPLLYDNGFVEANSAQSTWFVPHDLQGLFQLMGGKGAAVKRLSEQFEQSAWHRFCNEHPGENPKFVDDKRTWLNYSNQPNMQAAFIFNYAGAPWLTQYWSREVINQVFSGLTPYTGYNGDEDQGLMGTLNVLMKIGLFQMSGGCEVNPYYEIGSPVFDKVIVHLNPAYFKGRTFQIECQNNSNVNRYIGSATLNGSDLNAFRIRHENIAEGGELILQMSDTPNKQWGLIDR